jgi:hypothetical protein
VTTAATKEDLKLYIRDHYHGGQPLPDVHVDNLGDGRWRAYTEPELPDISDRREFVSVVAMATQRFHQVTPD